MKQQTDSQRAANAFLVDNYGGSEPALADIIKPARLKLNKASFMPSFMGNSVAGVEFEAHKGGIPQELDALTDAIFDCAINICRQTGTPKVLLHFDELDQGLSVVNERHEQMMIGLVLACRSCRRPQQSDAAIYPVAYLRTDIWDE